MSYFDLGESYGLADEVFPEVEVAPAADEDINFPLGHGLIVDLPDEIVRLWRETAARLAPDLSLMTRWSPDLGVTRTDFDRELATFAMEQSIDRCRLRVHGVGTVFAELRLGDGIPVPYIRGVLRCFEWAAYETPVSDALLSAAEGRVASALQGRSTPLADLSRRRRPKHLFSAFTPVIACIDEGDDLTLEQLFETFKRTDVIDFEDHGKLHYGWTACVLEPRKLYDWHELGDQDPWSPADQIARMEATIMVAHVFLGINESFVGLMRGEIGEQVAGYAGRPATGRSPEDLNRLRTLALAVVNLTEYAPVAPSAEDQAYFDKWEENADIEAKHRTIQNATEVLYSAQAAEQQSAAAKRQTVLNWIALVLASLSLISLGVVGYDFVRDDEALIDQQGERALLFAAFTLFVGILVVLTILATRSQGRRGRP